MKSLTSVLFYFSQADRQHPQTWCLRSEAKEPGGQREEPTGGAVRGPHTLQAARPGNSELDLLHSFCHRLIRLACQTTCDHKHKRQTLPHNSVTIMCVCCVKMLKQQKSQQKFSDCCSRSSSFLSKHRLALCRLFLDSRVRTLSHTRLPVREVADRQTSTSTPASICRYSRTRTCSMNGPFFSSSIGSKVFKV